MGSISLVLVLIVVVLMFLAVTIRIDSQYKTVSPKHQTTGGTYAPWLVLILVVVGMSYYCFVVNKNLSLGIVNLLAFPVILSREVFSKTLRDDDGTAIATVLHGGPAKGLDVWFMLVVLLLINILVLATG